MSTPPNPDLEPNMPAKQGPVPVQQIPAEADRLVTPALPSTVRRTGLAAILAGLLIFAGQAGELIFGSPSGLVTAVYVLLLAGGVVALGFALWGLRALTRSTRRGRAGVWLALCGVAVLVLFIIQVLVEVVQTGHVPENFVLFALGFLIAILGHLLLAAELRHSLGWAWVAPIVAAVGAIVALTVDVDPYHDIGLFIFEGAWVALGVALMRLKPAPGGDAASTSGQLMQ